YLLSPKHDDEDPLTHSSIPVHLDIKAIEKAPRKRLSSKTIAKLFECENHGDVLSSLQQNTESSSTFRTSANQLSRIDTNLSVGSLVSSPVYSFSPTFSPRNFLDGIIWASPYTSPTALSPRNEEEEENDEHVDLSGTSIEPSLFELYNEVDSHLHTTTLNNTRLDQSLKSLIKKTRNSLSGISKLLNSNTNSVETKEKDSRRNTLHFAVNNVLERQSQRKKRMWRKSLVPTKHNNAYISLPPEVHIHILSYIGLSGVLNASLVCVDLCLVCDMDLYWRDLCLAQSMSLQHVDKELRRYYVENQIRVALVGEPQVGKTSLQKRLVNNPSQIFESFNPLKNYNTHAHHQHEDHYIHFPYECSDRHKLNHNKYDVVLVCFSTECYSTLIRSKQWFRSLRSNKNKVAILVGLKTDIREQVMSENVAEEMIGLVPPDIAFEFASKNKFMAYVECSSKTKQGFNRLIDLIITGKVMSSSLLYKDKIND
ncbi:hypothetical protein AKO1_001254, partial [Acrasis kona]